MRTEELLKGASTFYCFIRKNENKLQKSGREESQLSWSDCHAKLCFQPYHCFLQVAAPFMLQLKKLLVKASWRAQSTTGARTGREQPAQMRELCSCRSSSAKQHESHVLPPLPPHITCKGQGNLKEVQKGEQDTQERSTMATLLLTVSLDVFAGLGRTGRIRADCLGRL